MGSSKEVTIGYKYFLGMHMVLCHGPVDSIERIDVGERTAWSGSVTADTTLYVNNPNLFGGEKKEGGVQGYVDIAMGLPTQAKNSYLISQLGSIIPAFRGVVSIILRQCYLTAMSPYPKAWAFLVKRIPGRTWYNAKAEINGGANGAHIIYETLTNSDWGMGYSTDVIDAASFTSVADTLYAEGLSLSFELTNTDSLENFIYSVVKHINGIFYTKPDTGKFALKLLRDDYTVSTLDSFDETNVITLESFERAGYAEMVNEIVVVYRPQGTKDDDSVTVQELASIQAQEGIISQTVNYPGIDNANNAARVAMRDLRQKSTPLARVKLKVLRSAWNKTIGDVIKFSWVEHGITDMVLRVLEVNLGNLTNGEILLNCVEDVFGLPVSTYVGDQPSGWVDPVQPPAVPSYRRLEEATYWDLARTLTQADFAYLTNTSVILKSTIGSPTLPNINYELWATASGGSYHYACDGNFAPHGTITTDITPIQTSITISALVGNITIFVPGSYGVIDTEVVRIDSINTSTGSVIIGRGCLDTVPVAHLQGARLFFNEGFQGFDTEEYSTGELLYGKVLPRTGQGLLAIASAPADSFTSVGRFAKPYPPGDLRLSTLSYPTTITVDLVITWKHRDRTQQLATLIDHTSGNIGPEAGTTYNLEIRQASNNALLESLYNTSLLTFTSGLYLINTPIKVILWSSNGGRTSYQSINYTFNLNNPNNLLTEASEFYITEDGLDYIIL